MATISGLDKNMFSYLIPNGVVWCVVGKAIGKLGTYHKREYETLER